MKRGRPTSFDQKKIAKILTPYYQRGVSASITARHTRLDVKTVRKYFREWDSQIIIQDDFLQRAKITKEKAIDALDDEILSLYNDEKEINLMKKIARETGNVTLFEKMSRLKLKISDQRVKIISSKTNLINTPTADVIASMEQKNV